MGGPYKVLNCSAYPRFIFSVETLRYVADYSLDYVLPPMTMGKGSDTAYMEIGKCSPL